ncbi:MAG: hypothetical protein WCA44_05480 [Acidobacteriaceae bacterium]
MKEDILEGDEKEKPGAKYSSQKKKSFLTFPAFRHGEQCTFRSGEDCRKVPLITSETFRGLQIVQPGGADNFLIILISGCLA